VITRKAYGGAYCVMASKHLRTDLNYAFPSAEIAVMGPDGAIKILYRNALKTSPDPEELRAEKIGEYRDKFASPYVAAQRGFIDEIIEPSTTRAKLITGLRMLQNKKDTSPPKKHNNMPL
jgi:acetyl-CoA carboxylase carboxyltransferase component